MYGTRSGPLYGHWGHFMTGVQSSPRRVHMSTHYALLIRNLTHDFRNHDMCFGEMQWGKWVTIHTQLMTNGETAGDGRDYGWRNHSFWVLNHSMSLRRGKIMREYFPPESIGEIFRKSCGEMLVKSNFCTSHLWNHEDLTISHLPIKWDCTESIEMQRGVMPKTRLWQAGNVEKVMAKTVMAKNAIANCHMASHQANTRRSRTLFMTYRRCHCEWAHLSLTNGE